MGIMAGLDVLEKKQCSVPAGELNHACLVVQPLAWSRSTIIDTTKNAEARYVNCFVPLLKWSNQCAWCVSVVFLLNFTLNA